MSKQFVSSIDGLKEIKVPCMKCGTPVKAIVAQNFKGTIRKFCYRCKNITDNDY